MPVSWDRLRAAWLDESGSATATPPDGLVLEHVTGHAGNLVIAPVSDEGGAVTDWPTFTLRHAHPAAQKADVGRAPFVLVVRVFAPDADRNEFRRWLDEEHSARQLTIPRVRWYLGYEQDGHEHSFLNIWGIDDPDVVDGEAWSEVRDTPWWARVSHVTATAERGVYRPVRA